MKRFEELGDVGPHQDVDCADLAIDLHGQLNIGILDRFKRRMNKRFVEVKYEGLAALFTGTLGSKQVLVAKVHAAVLNLYKVVILDLGHLRLRLALRNLANELAELIVVELIMALIRILLLLLLHLLLLVLARILAALLP